MFKSGRSDVTAVIRLVITASVPAENVWAMESVSLGRINPMAVAEEVVFRSEQFIIAHTALPIMVNSS
jgi:hypothetical protein